MFTPYTTLKRELGINETVLYDINKQLKVRTDYYRKQKHKHSGGKALYYTPTGKKKVTSYVEDVKKLQENMQDALYKLGYKHNEKNSNVINVLIGVGAYCYLQEQGFRLASIAYILKKNRTTLYHTKKVLQGYLASPVHKVVIDETIRQLTLRLQWQDQ